ncbi:putative cytosolic iron-sulfur protein assembly protein 1 [Candida viswanathii]|uniref:Probable cytosolic iron-sulfur protein assembly protein 1 n=1 Tax=Candida viswanathii TaxID=5486 RepID=A0A367YHH0_9ASCO|nr:putative cytosolic iron-sulfur protein assembly protein 1 [Candida viswanathii]
MVELIKSIKAHTDKAWSVSAHPTIPLLATASTDQSTKLYKLSSKQNFPLIAKLDDAHNRSIRSVSFKPPLGGVDNPPPNILDLPALASGSFDSKISIWGVDEPDSVYDLEEIIERQAEVLSSASNEWNLMAIIEGHENEVKCVDWNYDGRFLASCSRDKSVWIWETDPETLEEFECVSVLNDHSQDVKNVTWHPELNILASSSYDDTIRIYDQDDNDYEWNCVGILNGHEGTVWCSKFEDFKSPNADKNKIRLVSSSDDLTVRIWAANKLEDGSKSELPSSIREVKEMTWEVESVLPAAHKYPVYSVAWSAITGKIASAGSDGKIVIYSETSKGKWEIESVHELSHGVAEINCIIWARLDDKSEILVTAGDDGTINFWNP